MRLWICAAAVNGFLAVAFGAFAAHGLRGAIGPERLAWVETGSDYGMVHALALIGVALLWSREPGGRAPGSLMPPSRGLRFAGWGFLAGTLLFSGALYVMGITGLGALGAVVPIGGALLLGGWAALFVHGWGLRDRIER
jgi:uncharacterized membrane protein YgdD (TMEM256/DUF423 family)